MKDGHEKQIDLIDPTRAQAGDGARVQHRRLHCLLRGMDDVRGHWDPD